MRPRFVVDHCWLTRTTRVIDTVGLLEAELPFEPASGAAERVAAACELSRALFADLLLRPVSRPFVVPA